MIDSEKESCDSWGRVVFLCKSNGIVPKMPVLYGWVGYKLRKR